MRNQTDPKPSRCEISESCNSRHLSWLMKSCFPNPTDTIKNDSSPRKTTISSLPDDILLECLSRVPTASIQPVSLVCQRWSRLLQTPSFLRLRRHRQLLQPSLFALSASPNSIFTATLTSHQTPWKLSTSLQNHTAPLFPAHARLCAVGPTIYAVGRHSTCRYDTWTAAVSPCAPTLFPRKKFAAAAVGGKIYVAGGGAKTVEEYDPEADTWRVVADAPRCRYGCVGASADGVFYVIGGLKLGAGAAEAAHVYAGSMDLYDVEAGAWLRRRAVPGGGCVVAACAAEGFVYVLASHAVEVSFWSFDGRRGSGFGEWRRVKSPAVRVDGRVRFCCTGVGDKVVLVQVGGCIDDLLRRSGRTERGIREGLVLVYDTAVGDWARAMDLPHIMHRAACVALYC